MKLRLTLAAFAICATVGVSAERQKVPVYEVYAIKFASAPYGVKNLVAGITDDRSIDIAFTVWVVRGGGKTVMVDAGFYRDKFIQAWKPRDFVKPSEAVQTALGINPEDITDIIVSHSHWDHMDGVDLFPNALVHIQKEEYKYYLGPTGQILHNGGMDVIDAPMMMERYRRGGVNWVDGDSKEIFPGITVYTGGKHTHESQYVGVNTRKGIVILASDNAYLYENLEKHLAIAQTVDAESNLMAQTRMLKLAASPSLVVPGHDPQVFVRFPKPGNGVARIN